jgi:hypothetical protein
VSRTLLAWLTVLVCGVVAAQTADSTLRLRSTLERVEATSLVLKDRTGRLVSVGYGDDLAITEVLPIDPAALQSGAFVGTTAVPGPDGSLSAVEVHVFPEEARGRGEGHRPWDLQPGSTMTNATVTAVKPGVDDRAITLHYKDGEKTIHVPNGVPIVTMKPGDKSLLVTGAKVIVTGQVRNGQPFATRVSVGRNGFEPPM